MTTTCYSHPDREGTKTPASGWGTSLPYCDECHAANAKRMRANTRRTQSERMRSYSNAVRNYNHR